MTNPPLPPAFTRRPDALLLDQWAPGRAEPHHTLDATYLTWHLPLVAVVDVADVDLLADWYGDRTMSTYTIAVGIGDAELYALQAAASLNRVDLAVRADLLPHRFLLRRLLDRATTATPGQLRSAVTDAAAYDRRAHQQR